MLASLEIKKNDNNNGNDNTESSTLNKITRKRTVAPSIKVGCLATYKVSYFVNGYAIESRLSPEIKKWIEDAVEKFNDWKSIKALLRLSEHELDVLETNPIYNRFPLALLINYHDVQNNGALTPPMKLVLLSTTPMIHATYLPLCSTLESNAARSSVRSFLNDLMYSLEEIDYNKLYIDFNNKFKSVFPEFTDYYETHWHNKRRLWARLWRKDGRFNTKNLIESYHNQLKSCYFGRQDALRVRLGIKNLFLSKIEKERKEKAESIDIDEAISMITLDNDNNSFLCASFTTPNVFYTVHAENNHLTSCSCPDQVGLRSTNHVPGDFLHDIRTLRLHEILQQLQTSSKTPRQIKIDMLKAANTFGRKSHRKVNYHGIWNVMNKVDKELYHSHEDHMQSFKIWMD
ncbi:hypothetical protein G6F43_012105 [Rhizopus delemar]|nr:hypothetical protein G6F43_012105 [Rhizopus delemar]